MLSTDKSQCKAIEPKCLEFYPPHEEDSQINLFPESGRQCLFKESIYPIKPWPRHCIVFQGKDICNTYEIHEDGNHVKSCDIALKKGVCIPRNNKQNECLEFKHS